MSLLALFDIQCDGPGDGRRCVVVGRAVVGAPRRTVGDARFVGEVSGWRRRLKSDICPECQTAS